MRFAAVIAACLAAPVLAQTVEPDSEDIAGTIMNTVDMDPQTALPAPTANVKSVLVGNTTALVMPTTRPLSTGVSAMPVPSSNNTMLATSTRSVGLPFQPTAVGTNSAPSSSSTSGAVGSVPANSWFGLAVAAGLAAMQL